MSTFKKATTLGGVIHIYDHEDNTVASFPGPNRAFMLFCAGLTMSGGNSLFNMDTGQYDIDQLGLAPNPFPPIPVETKAEIEARLRFMGGDYADDLIKATEAGR